MTETAIVLKMTTLLLNIQSEDILVTDTAIDVKVELNICCVTASWSVEPAHPSFPVISLEVTGI